MVELFLISLIFSMSLSLIFYRLYKQEQLNYYSLLIFLFILSTWIIPTIAYSNKVEIGIQQNNYILPLLIVSVAYFIIQAATRYILQYLSKLFNSKKNVFSLILIFYGSILFIAIFINGIAMFYTLIMGSSILLSTYSLSMKWWVQTTDNRKCYQANWLIYSISFISFIFATLFSNIFRDIRLLNLKTTWSILFSIMCTFSILIGIALYLLPHKKENIYTNSFSKNKLFNNFNIKNFLSYPILLGINSFIFMSILTFYTYYFHKYFSQVSWILIATIFYFIGFLINFITVKWIMKMFSFFKLTIIGLLIMLLSIIIIITTSLLASIMWKLLVVAFFIFMIGFALINSVLLGDISHIEQKAKHSFFPNCLAVQSFGEALGFMFGLGITLLNINIHILSIVITSVIIFMIVFYFVIVYQNKLLLNELRLEFIEYEFLINTNNNVNIY